MNRNRHTSAPRAARRRRCAAEVAPGQQCTEPALVEDEVCVRHFGAALEQSILADPLSAAVAPALPAESEEMQAVRREQLQICDDWKTLWDARDRLNQQRLEFRRKVCLHWSILCFTAGLLLFVVDVLFVACAARGLFR